jgi:hypothetical protein
MAARLRGFWLASSSCCRDGNFHGPHVPLGVREEPRMVPKLIFAWCDVDFLMMVYMGVCEIKLSILHATVKVCKVLRSIAYFIGKSLALLLGRHGSLGVRRFVP